MSENQIIQLEVGKINNLEPITGQRLDYFRLVCQGKGMNECSEIMCISYRTVLQLRASLYDIFSVKSEIELVLAGIKHGLVEIV